MAIFKKPSYYYKAWNSDVFIDISKYISVYPSWSQVLSTELLEFRLSFDVPLDDLNNQIIIQSGDNILITTDKTRYSVLVDSLYGMIVNSGKELIGWDYASDKPKLRFNLTCRQRDFSTDVFTVQYSNTSMTTILNDILINHTGENLGGILSNGGQILKYQLISPDVNIESFESSGTALEVLSDLLKQSSYYFKIKYSVEPDINTLAKVFSQLIIFDKSGQNPKGGSSWENGIRNNELKKGVIVNPRIFGAVKTVGISKEPNTLASEKEFAYQEDRDLIKNYITLYGKLQDEITSSNPLDNTGMIKIERYEEIVQGVGKDTFTLPYSAKDILFVARSVMTKILKSPTPTSSIVYIPLVDSEIVYTGNIARIVLDGIEYFRTITKSKNKITLSYPLPYIPKGNEIFEIVGNVTIYNDNQYVEPIVTNILSSPAPSSTLVYLPSNDVKKMSVDSNCKIRIANVDYIRTIADISDNKITLNLPLAVSPSGNEKFEIVQVNYASSGCVKDVKQSDNGQIRFLEYDIPNPNDKVVIYYYCLQDFKETQVLSESIKRYGLLPYKEQIEFSLTKAQIKEIFNYLEQAEPNQTITFTSYREDICQVGWTIPIDITDFANGKFIVNQVDCNFLGGVDKRGSYMIEQQINLSTLKESLENILSRFKKQNQISEPTIDESIGQKQPEEISIYTDYFTSLDINLERNYEFIINANTKIYYDFQEGSGTIIRDRTTNNNNGSIIFGSGTPYNWSSRIIDIDSYSLTLAGQNTTGSESANPCYIRIPYTSNLKPTSKFTMRYLLQITDITKYTALMTIYYPNQSYASNRVIRPYLEPVNSTTMNFTINIFENTNPYRVLTLYSNIPITNNSTKLIQFAIDFDNDVYNLIINNVSYPMSVRNDYPYTYTNLAGISSFSSNINQENANNYIYLGIQNENNGANKYNSIQAKLIRFAYDIDYRTSVQATADYNNFFG